MRLARFRGIGVVLVGRLAFHVRDVSPQVLAVFEKPVHAACEKPGSRSITSCSSNSTGQQRNDPDQGANAQRNDLAVAGAAGRNKIHPARPTTPSRRGCSWRRRWRRSARRILTRCLHRRDLRRPAPGRWRAWWRSRSSSRRCRRLVRGGRRWAAAERSKTPMLSSPRNPPPKDVCPRYLCD